METIITYNQNKMAFTSGIPAALQPTQTKTLYAGNYIDFTAAGFSQWTQQFLPNV